MGASFTTRTIITMLTHVIAAVGKHQVPILFAANHEEAEQKVLIPRFRYMKRSDYLQNFGVLSGKLTPMNSN